MGHYESKDDDDTTFCVTAGGEKVEDFDFGQNGNGYDEWGPLRLCPRLDTQVDEESGLTLHVDVFDIDATLGVAGSRMAPAFCGFTENDTRSRGIDVLLETVWQIEAWPLGTSSVICSSMDRG